MLTYITFIAGSYIFGSLPFVMAIAKASGLDTAKEEDLHIALWHKIGKGRALLAGFSDFLKGSIPVIVSYSFNLSPAVAALSGVAAVGGQMWPPFRSWHGEKGNTTGAGVAVALAIAYQKYYIFLAFIPAIVGVYFALFRESGPSRCLPVGTLLAFAIAPISSWCSQQPKGMTLSLLALFIIIIIRRLTADIKTDLKTGNSVVKILVSRLIFDQLFIDRIEK